jgi:ABC-2 type transport system permease protein
MNYAMVNHLIRKEWHFSRIPIAILFSVGVVMLIALGITTNMQSSLVRLVLLILFFAVFNLMFWLPTATILPERTEQTLAFLVSLPITMKEYTVAKIVANLGVVLIAWLLLSGGLISLILMTAVPKAYIPPTIIVLLQALVLFCVVMAAALVSESAAWTMTVCVIGNFVFWLSVAFISGLGPGMGDPVATWHKLWWMVPAEAAAIPVILGLAVFFQSRKTDFLR